MNLFQLVLKQMRQRALGTWLTLLSVVLGVALGVAVLSVRAGSESLLSQTDFGYDLIIGKGSPTQLVLNTVYHVDSSPGNIPYSLYESLSNPRHPYAKQAVPIFVGDTYKNRRIVATIPKMFAYDDDGKRLADDDPKAFRYRPGKRFELASGRMFHPRKFEAVIGSEVTELSGLKLGDEFVAVHGAPDEGQKEHVHEEKWKVVGVLQPTRTSNDRVIFTPLMTAFAIDEHRLGAEAQNKARSALEGRPTIPGVPAVPGRPTRPFPPTPAPSVPTPAPATKPDAHEEHDHDEKHADDDHKHEHAEDKDDHKHEHAENDKHEHAKKDEHDHGHDEHEHAKKDGHDHDHHDSPATTTAPAAAPPAKHDLHHGHVHEGVAHEHDAYTIDADGTIEVKLPKDQWLLSAILVKTREVESNGRMISNPLPLKYVIDATGSAVAVMPAQEMSKFLHQIMRVPRLVMLIVACLVTVVAAVGILVSIYNSVSARMREIAILRALGATRMKVLALICVEAALIGVAGAVLGFVAGHLISAIGSEFTERLLGQRYDWMAVAWEEPVFLLGVVLLTVLAGLVPAMKAYRTPVATNLVAT